MPNVLASCRAPGEGLHRAGKPPRWCRPMLNAANELLILGLLVVANGIMTAAETAFVSARKERLRRMAEGGGEGAAAALAIAEHPGRFLGLVQFWLTLTSVIAGVALVASAAEEFSTLFARWPLVSPWAETFGLVAGTLVV